MKFLPSYADMGSWKASSSSSVSASSHRIHSARSRLVSRSSLRSSPIFVYLRA